MVYPSTSSRGATTAFPDLLGADRGNEEEERHRRHRRRSRTRGNDEGYYDGYDDNYGRDYVDDDDDNYAYDNDNDVDSTNAVRSRKVREGDDDEDDDEEEHSTLLDELLGNEARKEGRGHNDDEEGYEYDDESGYEPFQRHRSDNGGDNIGNHSYVQDEIGEEKKQVEWNEDAATAQRKKPDKKKSKKDRKGAADDNGGRHMSPSSSPSGRRREAKGTVGGKVRSPKNRRDEARSPSKSPGVRSKINSVSFSTEAQTPSPLSSCPPSSGGAGRDRRASPPGGGILRHRDEQQPAGKATKKIDRIAHDREEEQEEEEIEELEQRLKMLEHLKQPSLKHVGGGGTSPSSPSSGTTQKSDKMRKGKSRHSTPTDDITMSDDEDYGDRDDRGRRHSLIEKEYVCYSKDKRRGDRNGGGENEYDDDDHTASSISCEDEEDSGDDDDEDPEDEKTAETNDLLDRAHDRIALSKMTEEVERLKDVIETKNEEISNLSGQLRRAISTKCDLVLAHTQLERDHEYFMNAKEQNLKNLKRENCTLQELRAEIELEFMNEIANLTQANRDAEEKHRAELDDWERMHRNEMLEKDMEIAKLSERLRRVEEGIGGSSGGSLGSSRRGGGGGGGGNGGGYGSGLDWGINPFETASDDLHIMNRSGPTSKESKSGNHSSTLAAIKKSKKGLTSLLKKVHKRSPSNDEEKKSREPILTSI